MRTPAPVTTYTLWIHGALPNGDSRLAASGLPSVSDALALVTPTMWGRIDSVTRNHWGDVITVEVAHIHPDWG